MSLVVFSVTPWFPSSNSFPCAEAVYFVSFLHEATIRSRTVHTVARGTDQFTHLCILYISRRYAWLCFQKDRLHSADATAIPVGSFRRDLWMSLYEAYFVWLPTYFQCAVCAHLCLGLRRLCCMTVRCTGKIFKFPSLIKLGYWLDLSISKLTKYPNLVSSC